MPPYSMQKSTFSLELDHSATKNMYSIIFNSFATTRCTEHHHISSHLSLLKTWGAGALCCVFLFFTFCTAGHLLLHSGCILVDLLAIRLSLLTEHSAKSSLLTSINIFCHNEININAKHMRENNWLDLTTAPMVSTVFSRSLKFCLL